MAKTIILILSVGLVIALWNMRDQKDWLWANDSPRPSKGGYDEIVIAPGHTGRASVIDGDTIEIQGKRIRLTGIDAPESDQQCERNGQHYRCGQQAANALADRIRSWTVTCLQSGTDQYKRILADCFIGRDSLNKWMVQQGHAMAFRRYSTEYVGDEDQARTAKRGIWAGQFQPPWEFRSRSSVAGSNPALGTIDINHLAHDQIPDNTDIVLETAKPWGNTAQAYGRNSSRYLNSASCVRRLAPSSNCHLVSASARS